MRYMRVFALTIAVTVATLAWGQQRSAAYEQYIEKYADAAIEQMHRYRIPASITLAQALLESGAGNSYLATKANNHFGIKVGMNWTGPYVMRDDDKKNDRFRKYKNAAESYEDHSKFLQQQRYKRLFDLDPTDYKGWARGLKACGYATLPTYANRLIDIIETYDLHQYDEDRHGQRKRHHEKQETKPEKKIVAARPVQMVNGKPCVTWRNGDTWESLAKEMKVSRRKLLSVNEIDADFLPPVGTNIFLAKKATKAAREYKGVWHKVKPGESMYTISQFYGIRLRNLYKMNFKDWDYLPVTGDLLRVR